jgi:hypothetical protein
MNSVIASGPWADDVCLGSVEFGLSGVLVHLAVQKALATSRRAAAEPISLSEEKIRQKCWCNALG